MILANDLRILRDRGFADLDSAHDYYEDTRIAWRLVRRLIASGQTFTHRNMATGTMTTQSELASKARGYVTDRLNEATFQQFIAIFEYFFLDLLRLWLKAYPQSLGAKKVDFRTILETPDMEAINSFVVDKELNEVLYQRPSEWFIYLETKAKLGCPSPGEIQRIAEAKATRDVLIHNRGIVSETYLTKSGSLARGGVGDKIIVSDQYHRETWELIRKVITDLSNASIAKAV